MLRFDNSTAKYFAVKKLLLCDDKNSDYLIYNPITYADIKDGWPLDIECCSEEFRADMISIKMAEYNMPNNPTMRKTLKLYNKFFVNKECAAKLAALHSDYSYSRQLHIDVMAVTKKEFNIDIMFVNDFDF